MKVLYNGKEVFEVTANRSLTIKEALYSHGIDTDDREDLKTAYEAGEPFVYCEDDYAVDWDGLEMEY